MNFRTRILTVVFLLVLNFDLSRGLILRDRILGGKSGENSGNKQSSSSNKSTSKSGCQQSNLNVSTNSIQAPQFTQKEKDDSKILFASI